jgi:hypothetical protein
LQPLLVIAGMHRSGTSLVAAMCQTAGLNIGSRLVGPHASNPGGHFEDRSFYEFHERVLGANGRIPAGYEIHDAPLRLTDAHLSEAQNLVAERRKSDGPWGWKDPRTVLFLDFWREQLPDARFLFVIRSPWQVANSLARRDKERFRHDPCAALRLWYHYNTQIRDHAAAHPQTTLVRGLDQIIAAPQETFAAIRDHLNVPLSDPEAVYREEWLVADDVAHSHAAAAALEKACQRLHDDLGRLARADAAAAGTTIAETTVAASSPRKNVAVVIPVHRLPLTADEETSLAQARHYLSIHDRIVVAPMSLDVGDLGLPVRRFDDRHFKDVASYSKLMLDMNFYAAFDDYDSILFHQLDCLVFSFDLEHWCRRGWDYVGAPWFPEFSAVANGQPWRAGNGGLSLRRIEAMRRILARQDVQQFLSSYDRNEDLFWSFEAPRFDPNFVIPAASEALAFSMESDPRACFALNGNALPFGCHYWPRVDRRFWENFLVAEARQRTDNPGNMLDDATHPDHAWMLRHAKRMVAAIAATDSHASLVKLVTPDLSDAELDAPPTAATVEEAFQRMIGRTTPRDWLDFWVDRKDLTTRQLYGDLVRGAEFTAMRARLAPTSHQDRARPE